MGGFCLLVEVHREGCAPAACAVGCLPFHDMTDSSKTSIWQDLQKNKYISLIVAQLEPSFM